MFESEKAAIEQQIQATKAKMQAAREKLKNIKGHTGGKKRTCKHRKTRRHSRRK